MNLLRFGMPLKETGKRIRLSYEPIKIRVMEHLTIYFIIFLAGIILGGIGIMSLLPNRWSSYGTEYDAPYNRPYHYPPYPVQRGSGMSVLLAIIFLAAVLLILAGESMKPEKQENPVIERMEIPTASSDDYNY